MDIVCIGSSWVVGGRFVCIVWGLVGRSLDTVRRSLEDVVGFWSVDVSNCLDFGRSCR